MIKTQILLGKIRKLLNYTGFFFFCFRLCQKVDQFRFPLIFFLVFVFVLFLLSFQITLELLCKIINGVPRDTFLQHFIDGVRLHFCNRWIDDKIKKKLGNKTLKKFNSPLIEVEK